MGTMLNRRRVMGGEAEKMILATLTLTDDSVVVINGEGALTADMVADYMSTCKYFVAGDNCTALENAVLRNCTTLKSVVLSDSVLDVGRDAFRNCSNIEYIDFGHGVRRLQWLAFYSVDSLKELHIPASISYGFSENFTYHGKLTVITVEDGCPLYDSRDGCNCLMRTSDDALMVGSKNSVIPNSCKIIFGNAFSRVDITSIIIPNGVTSIGSSAFSSSKLNTSITIPDSVATIGQQAFRSTAIPEVIIGSGVTSIGQYNFGSCFQLAKVTILATTPPALGGNAFTGNKAGRKIYVPAESVEAYKTAAGWSTYADDIEAIPT